MINFNLHIFQKNITTLVIQSIHFERNKNYKIEFSKQTNTNKQELEGNAVFGIFMIAYSWTSDFGKDAIY